jgi:hypothetical protein
MAALGDDFFVQTFTATLQKYEKVLVDNVLLEHPTLELFKANSKSITGRGLVIPVRAANLNSTAFDTASGSGGFSDAASADIMGSAVYGWAKGIITPFRVKHREILQNSGAEQIVNLVEEYVKAAAADHGDFITSQLHALGGSYNTDSFNSLDMLVGNAASDTTSAITVGGITHNRRATVSRARAAGVATIGVANATTYFSVGDLITVIDLPAAYNVTNVAVTGVTSTTVSYPISVTTTETTAADTGGKVFEKGYWQAGYRDNSSAAATDIVAALRLATNEIYRASRKRPTNVIVGFDVYEELEAYLAEKGQLQQLGGPSTATRFNEIKFGDLIVRLDPDCQDDRAYLLNKDSLRFAYCAGEFMKAFPAQVVPGTLDTVVPLASTITVGVSERRANGLIIRTA